jgi:integrase
MAGRRQHGEGSLYFRKDDSRWIATVHLGYTGKGKRSRRVFTGTTPEIALRKRTEFLGRRRDGFTMPKGRQPFVSEWMLHWLHVIAKPKVAPTTWQRSYQGSVERHIAPYFARVPLPELDEEQIEAFHAHLMAGSPSRPGLSASSVAQIHRIMSRALKVAVARGRIARNPCSNVSPPAADPIELAPPSAAEVDAILARCATWPNGARWVLAITTGLRQGEALGLEWRDVELAAPASVTVRQAAAWVDGERILKQPKSRASRRTVPLPAEAVAALRRHHGAQAVRDVAGTVFVTPAGKPVNYRADWQDWQDLLADLGLPRYRVHDLRHGYATMLLEQGVDPRVVQAMLGHATAALLTRYQHVRPLMHQAVSDAVDRAVRR